MFTLFLSTQVLLRVTLVWVVKILLFFLDCLECSRYITSFFFFFVQVMPFDLGLFGCFRLFKLLCKLVFSVACRCSGCFRMC